MIRHQRYRQPPTFLDLSGEKKQIRVFPSRTFARSLFKLPKFPLLFLSDQTAFSTISIGYGLAFPFRALNISLSARIQSVCGSNKMSRAAGSNVFNGDLAAAVNHFLNFPENIGKFMVPSHSDETHETKGASSIPVDILDTPKEYIFYMDVPGLSKSDIQVTVEDEKTLVIRSNGKRKREDGEEEGCKYIRLERRAPQKLMRKFRLPENCNVSTITAKCENGVLTVVVEKLPPPPKSKSVKVSIA